MQAVTAAKTVVIRVRGHNLLVPTTPLDDPTSAPGTALTAAQLGRFVDVTGAEVTGVAWPGPDFLEVALAAAAPAGAELTVQTGAGSVVRYELGHHVSPNANGGAAGGVPPAASLVAAEVMVQADPPQAGKITRVPNGGNLPKPRRKDNAPATSSLAQPGVQPAANGQHTM